MEFDTKYISKEWYVGVPMGLPYVYSMFLLIYLLHLLVHRMHDGAQLELNLPAYYSSQWSCRINELRVIC